MAAARQAGWLVGKGAFLPSLRRAAAAGGRPTPGPGGAGFHRAVLGGLGKRRSWRATTSPGEFLPDSPRGLATINGQGHGTSEPADIGVARYLA